MTTLQGLRTHSLNYWLDRVGGIGAFLCAIHCALLPIAMALLPVAGLGGLASAGFEHGFLVFAVLLGVSNLTWSYRKHRAQHALALFVLGITLIVIAIFVPVVHASTFWHASLMTSGGALIAVAHWINLRLMKVRPKSCKR